MNTNKKELKVGDILFGVRCIDEWSDGLFLFGHNGLIEDFMAHDHEIENENNFLIWFYKNRKGEPRIVQIIKDGRIVYERNKSF